jgi:sugar transferase (PEP-CTERM/EpsH1 system associated)
MRIVYIIPNVPSLVRVRPFNFIRRLSRVYEVSVLCVATNEVDYRAASELRQHCQSVEVVKLPRWRSLWHCLVGLLSAKSVRFSYFYSSALRHRVEEKVSRGEVDLVHVEHLKSFPMVEGIKGKVPMIFDAVDCVSMFEEKRRRALRNPSLKLFSWMEWKRMARWESEAARVFNRVVISSPVDKECYPVRERLREKIDVIPNGVDLEHFGFQQFESQKNLIVFCAKLDYFANEDAALHFSRSIWPLLRARRPELKLEIVGSRPPQSVRQLNGRDNIRVVGSVPDVRPHLGRAWVAICPVRVRAGIQNKILEAMALGVPVVTHSICCAGLKVEPGKHLLAADKPEEFASAVELILDNHALRDELVQAGRKYVEQSHSWDDSVKRLLESYDEAVAHFQASRRNGLAGDLGTEVPQRAGAG